MTRRNFFNISSGGLGAAVLDAVAESHLLLVSTRDEAGLYALLQLGDHYWRPLSFLTFGNYSATGNLVAMSRVPYLPSLRSLAKSKLSLADFAAAAVPRVATSLKPSSAKRFAISSIPIIAVAVSRRRFERTRNTSPRVLRPHPPAEKRQRFCPRSLRTIPACAPPERNRRRYPP